MPLTPFDASHFLNNETEINEYLMAALEDPNPDVFLSALGDVAKVRGLTQIAKKAGLGRASLYKTLSPGAKPRYETVRRLIAALGIKLAISM